MVKLAKIVLPFFFWAVWGYVILKVEYPTSLTQANLFQLSSFFILLFLALTLSFNLLLKFFIPSAVISLGVIFLLILQALATLNIVTGALTVIAVWLLFSYFRKIKRRSLTKLPKISKLTQLQGRKK